MKQFRWFNIFFAFALSLSAYAEVGTGNSVTTNSPPTTFRCYGKILRSYLVNNIRVSEEILVKNIFITDRNIQMTYLQKGKTVTRDFQVIDFMKQDQKLSPQDANLYKFLGSKSGSTNDLDRIEVNKLGRRLVTHFARSADVKFMLNGEQVFSTLFCPL